MKTFKIYTLGCKVNQYDSQVIREQLERAGLKEIRNGKKANYYIVNTCTVTNNADKQSRYLIRLSKRKNPLAKIVVIGCYAHSNAEDIRRIKDADLILDNDNKNRITEYLFPNRKIDAPDYLEINDFKGHTRAFVKIQDGCNNFCSFCKVPYVRGRSRSRDFDSIINEIKRLSEKRYKEIVLTGICLGDYGKDLKEKIDLVDLIDEVEKIKRVLRIRLSSIEAKDISDRLIEKMKKSKKLCPHLHIPFQSGDDKILKLMNRRDKRQDYLKLVKKLRKNIKDIAITADIMIGFPKEGEKEFLNTLDFLKKVRPARVHIFTFQPRDGTPLSNFKSNTSKDVLRGRYIGLKTLTDNLAFDFKSRFMNQSLEVLFEERKEGFWQGYSQNYLLTGVRISDNLSLSNEIVKVKIKKVNSTILTAKLQR